MEEETIYARRKPVYVKVGLFRKTIVGVAIIEKVRTNDSFTKKTTLVIDDSLLNSQKKPNKN